MTTTGTKVYSVRIGSNVNSETTKDEMVRLAAAGAVSLEFQPSRQFDECEIVKINGQHVAYNFADKASAIAYMARYAI